jgi:hypothetical protein
LKHSGPLNRISKLCNEVEATTETEEKNIEGWGPLEGWCDQIFSGKLGSGNL